jgi:hypothetical protein
LGSANQSNDRYYQQYGIREEDRRFIEQEYISKVDPSFVEKDNEMPIWAILYLYFRAGKLYELKQFIDRYEGRLTGNVKAFDKYLHSYFQRGRKMDNKFAAENLAGGLSTKFLSFLSKNCKRGHIPKNVVRHPRQT